MKIQGLDCQSLGPESASCLLIAEMTSDRAVRAPPWASVSSPEKWVLRLAAIRGFGVGNDLSVESRSKRPPGEAGPPSHLWPSGINGFVSSPSGGGWQLVWLWEATETSALVSSQGDLGSFHHRALSLILWIFFFYSPPKNEKSFIVFVIINIYM